jgi:hypothetical protein
MVHPFKVTVFFATSFIFLYFQEPQGVFIKNPLVPLEFLTHSQFFFWLDRLVYFWLQDFMLSLLFKYLDDSASSFHGQRYGLYEW